MARENRTWLRGAVLLTLAGLISKVLSAGYRIPLQNFTGDLGFYIYQQVYPLLGMALVLSLYGFPSAISQLAAESARMQQALTARHFYLPVLSILLGVMGTLALLLFLFAEQLAGAIGDPSLVRAYQLAAVSFLVVPFTSLLRGVFQGRLNMKPTAYSQIGEQLIRVLVIIIAAVIVGMQGIDIYRIGEGAALASIAGGLAGAGILLFFFHREKTPVLKEPDTPIPWRKYFQTLLLLGFAAALNHMVLLLFQFADAITLVPALMESGLGEIQAMEAKGVLDRGQPLIQLGAVLGSSFALAMIPSISANRIQENPDSFYEETQSSMAVNLYLAAGATAGLVAIMPEANILLYENDLGTSDLRILMLAVMLTSLGITAATILQGIGKMKRTAAFILLAVAVNWTGNKVFVPLLGITGSAWATVAGLTVFAVLVLMELKRSLPDLKLTKHISWKALVLATFLMLLYIFIIDQWMPETLSRAQALLYVVFIAGSGAGIYLTVLLRGRAFKQSEINVLPFSKIWLRIYKERRTDE